MKTSPRAPRKVFEKEEKTAVSVINIEKKADFIEKCKRIQNLLNTIIEAQKISYQRKKEGILINGKRAAIHNRILHSQENERMNNLQTFNSLRSPINYNPNHQAIRFIRKHEDKSLRKTRNKITIPLSVWSSNFCIADADINLPSARKFYYMNRNVTAKRAYSAISLNPASVELSPLKNELLKSPNNERKEKKDQGEQIEFEISPKQENIGKITISYRKRKIVQQKNAKTTTVSKKNSQEFLALAAEPPIMPAQIQEKFQETLVKTQKISEKLQEKLQDKTQENGQKSQKIESPKKESNIRKINTKIVLELPKMITEENYNKFDNNNY